MYIDFHVNIDDTLPIRLGASSQPTSVYCLLCHGYAVHIYPSVRMDTSVGTYAYLGASVDVMQVRYPGNITIPNTSNTDTIRTVDLPRIRLHP